MGRDRRAESHNTRILGNAATGYGPCQVARPLACNVPSAPSHAIGGGPKTRGRHALMRLATPPPPTNAIGVRGRIPQGKVQVSNRLSIIWRSGVLHRLAVE